jgi:hypothetical protein
MKRWRTVVIVFLALDCLGIAALLLWLLAGAARRAAAPAPTLIMSTPATPAIGYRPVPWADVTLTSTLRPTPTATLPMIDGEGYYPDITIPPEQIADTVTPRPGPSYRWEDLIAVGLQVELPSDWDIQGEIFQHGCDALGGTLAKYYLTSPAHDYAELAVTCPPIPGMLIGPCMLRPVILDESRRIYREVLAGMLVSYSGYAYQGDVMQCPALGWPVGERYVIGTYYNRKTFTPDYPAVDRIMLSVREK